MLKLARQAPLVLRLLFVFQGCAFTLGRFSLAELSARRGCKLA